MKYFDPAFERLPLLCQRIKNVLAQVPQNYRDALIEDEGFRISLDDFEPGKGRTVLMAAPGTNGHSRSVVLKPRLEKCSDAFCCYIIAHEIAHAWLNNGGWGEITDREEAADALAATWGFKKVPYE